MVLRVNQVAAEFRKVSNKQMADTTKRTIRENVSIQAQLGELKLQYAMKMFLLGICLDRAWMQRMMEEKSRTKKSFYPLGCEFYFQKVNKNVVCKQNKQQNRRF